MGVSVDENGDLVYVDDDEYTSDDTGLAQVYVDEEGNLAGVGNPNDTGEGAGVYVNSDGQLASYDPLTGLDINTGEKADLSSGNSGGWLNTIAKTLGLTNTGGTSSGKSGSTLSGLGGLASLAATLAPLLKKGYTGPVDQQGRPIQLQDISKFVPGGSYKPVDLGYSHGYGAVDPFAFNPTELAVAKEFFSKPRTPDEIYSGLASTKLSPEQGADVWSKVSGGNRQEGLGLIQGYLNSTGKTLPGGFIPGDNMRPGSAPAIRTKYTGALSSIPQGGRSVYNSGK